MSVKNRVLLVDDDADFVELHRVVLENNGYKVDVAYNGDQCREKIKDSMPDIVVLDIMMATPLEGIFVAQELRRSEASKNIPIVVVTAANDVPGYCIGPDPVWLPADEFMQKPIAPEQLLAQVTRTIGTHSTVLPRGGSAREGVLQANKLPGAGPKQIVSMQVKRLLLADNDADFVARHKDVLQENGYEVTVASSSDQCREKVASASPDIVVVDISSPMFLTVLEIMMAAPSDRMFAVQDVRKDETSKDLLQSLMLLVQRRAG